MRIYPAIILIVFLSCSQTNLIRIPADYSTIQAGIDAALDGDIILVSPGVYHENLRIKGKSIVLASNYLKSEDVKDIETTVIDGDGETVLFISDAGPETAVVGFTIQNGDDGIYAEAKFLLMHNRIRRCVDGIDYEKHSGGVCSHNVFESNTDDGIDLDEDVDIIVEKNLIRNNDDDGIEIRLHEYKGKELVYIIRNNYISGHGEDGIQIIDYPDTSNRVLIIRNNIITRTKMAAIGCMSDSNTVENYEAAPIPERIYLLNNTIVDSEYGICGGANMIVLNNIISKSRQTGLKGIREGSVVAHNLLWENARNMTDCHAIDGTFLMVDPRLKEDFTLVEESPAIDGGIVQFNHKGEVVLDMEEQSYAGKRVDMGAIEFGMKSWLNEVLSMIK